MDLKLDDSGKPVLQDGKPVFVADGKEVALDVGDLFASKKKLSDDLDTLRRRNGEALKPWEGLDPAKVRAELAEAQKLRDEMAAGKVGKSNEELDKLVQERYGRQLSDVEAKATSLDGKLSEANKALERKHELLRARAIDSEVSIVAAELGGFQPSALKDARREARELFQLDDEGNPVARDSQGNPVFGADGKTPLSIKEWLAGTKKSSAHWWQANANGGGAGGGGGAAGAVVMTRAEAENVATYRAKRAEAEKRGVPLQIAG